MGVLSFISVENTPSYFAGSGGLWVHNSKCAITPKGTKAIAKNDNGDFVDPLDKSQIPIHIVDLPSKEKVNFIGKPVPVKLKPGTVIYRVHDGGVHANPNGGYWTLELPKNKAEWRNRWAVKEQWNDGTQIIKYTIKEEDNLGGWIGGAAKQGNLNGQGTQLYIDGWNLPEDQLKNIQLPDDWNN